MSTEKQQKRFDNAQAKRKAFIAKMDAAGPKPRRTVPTLTHTWDGTPYMTDRVVKQ